MLQAAMEDKEWFDSLMPEATPYSRAGVQEILNAFQPRAGLDRLAFARDLQEAAWWFIETRKLKAETDSEERAPSLRVRWWRTRAKQLERLEREIHELSWVRRGELLAGARELATKEGALPNEAPETVIYAPLPSAESLSKDSSKIWPVERQLDHALKNVSWLRRSAEAAAATAKLDSAPSGGNRSDAARSDFFHSLFNLYRTSAVRPSAPYRDRASNQPRGEFLQFVDTCFSALGGASAASPTLEAIYSLYFDLLSKEQRDSLTPYSGLLSGNQR